MIASVASENDGKKVIDKGKKVIDKGEKVIDNVKQKSSITTLTLSLSMRKLHFGDR